MGCLSAVLLLTEHAQCDLSLLEKKPQQFNSLSEATMTEIVLSVLLLL